MRAGEVVSQGEAHRVIGVVPDEGPVIEPGLFGVGDFALHHGRRIAPDLHAVGAEHAGEKREPIVIFLRPERAFDGVFHLPIAAIPGVPANRAHQGADASGFFRLGGNALRCDCPDTKGRGDTCHHH